MDNDDTSNEPRAKRQKTNDKSAIFERLKQLKSKGSKNKYEVKEMDNVYEMVDEKEYSETVWHRQIDNWIVDDDGAGYVEDGRDIFDDDLDSESIATASKQSESRKKKKNLSKNATKGNIQALLSNMPEKRKEVINLEQDDILSDVLSGMDDTSVQTKSSDEHLQESEEQSAKDYMKNFSAPKPMKIKLKSHVIKSEKRPRTSNILKELPVEANVVEDVQMETVDEISNEIEDANTKIVETVIEDKKAKVDTEINEYASEMFDDDFTFDNIDEDIDECRQSENNRSKNKIEITEENLISGWETMQDEINNETETDIIVNNSDLPLVSNTEGDQVFRFYWWDAYEDVKNQPGIVFFFGKTFIESAKSYVSCCVAVRNIDRKIYLLPRPFHLSDEKKSETDVPVKLVDVYHEFNNNIAERLNIQQFRTRKVTKKYAFDPEIPTKSDYLEVRYSAKNAPLNDRENGKTYSHVFGVKTSFLEILLLDRKIKGPCWLEIKNAKPVKNPLSWCKLEVNCINASHVSISDDYKTASPPPLVVAALNIRTIANKNQSIEIVMIGCLVHNQYCIDKQPPNPPFQQHFCVFTKPQREILPLDCHETLKNYKATQVQKCDSEKALLNYFLSRFINIDPDLVVGHDLLDFHLGMLCNRLKATRATQWSRFGRLKRHIIPFIPRHQQSLMVGRLVCDLKISARELIKSRSYDFDTLCQTILKLKDGERPMLEVNDILKMFGTSQNLIKLINLTMQDALYLTNMLYELNVMPLALQITNIAGNVMSKTLQGGRAQRNEYLLLHAFTEKNYICPDKTYSSAKGKNATEIDGTVQKASGSSRKKPTYSGGLVLDPKIGFYDRLILLMDFNSLYPSIMQEYNICFTTMAENLDTETMLSTVSSEPGILPIEIKKLVESRRQVKKLMASPNISKDLQMQYNIRQLALKLTANSMYGCLGFANSRFFAKHLASLVTMKGRDILLHTKDLVQAMGFDVIYGDTDSIMINTNILDYDQVFRIGNNIKQAVNKCYRQIELDVDGVFKYMLLLKKKKYAAVTVSKNKNGEVILQQEHKGLDIVRRDWSMIASEVGKMILNHILSEQTPDERIEDIQSILTKIAADLNEGKVPLRLLIITKTLTKNPALYTEKTGLSHVLVAMRYNQKVAKPLGAGDTVPYVICEDGTNASATQRAYHIDELKQQSDKLKIDVKYYLAQQIHPVVSRLCEPIEGLDAFYIANCLGIDAASFKQSKPKQTESDAILVSASVKKFQNVKHFEFQCLHCKQTNTVSDLFTKSSAAQFWLEKCSNEQCKVKPIEYLSTIENKFVKDIRKFVGDYYGKIMICEDPLCPNETSIIPKKFVGKYPVCNLCNAGVMYRKYSERELYEQLCFYKHICNLTKLNSKKIIDQRFENEYQILRENVEYFVNKSGYSRINMTELFKDVDVLQQPSPEEDMPEIVYEEDEDEQDDI